MPIQTVGSDRLYRKIARQLSELIDAGEFVAGQRLPAERELAEQLGVSRPSVREALIALEIEGRVDVRVGSGVFIAKSRPVKAVSAGGPQGEGPFELLQARITVEGEVAALAAQGASVAELAEIHNAVTELQRCQRQGLPTDASDRAFHLAIARATHNGPLASMVELLWDQGRGQMWKQMEKHFQTASLRAATLRDHRAIATAIAARDPKGAREAMKAHLGRVSREFARGLEARSNDATPGAAANARRKR
jgi:GntR family transcriptional regulator, uxu operon transcriptional repressor